ncbi:hypothetical protein KW786_03995 [Candidatus Parcubacteria bacterium]|nr:hypothetical protein [Candidatus Parcubacteria bacterium]
MLLGMIFGEATLPIPDRYEDEFDQELEEAVERLTFGEREVINLRYALGDGRQYSLEDIGRILRIKPEDVNRLEGRALEHLRRHEQKQMLRKFFFSVSAQP